MNLRTTAFAFGLAAFSIVGCSSSSGTSSSSPASNESDPFTSAIILDPSPADGATGIAGNATVTIRFADSVGDPLTADNRLFKIVMDSAVITNTDSGTTYATATSQGSLWEDDTTFAMSPDDAMQCNANYSIDVIVHVEESHDNGTTWAAPGFTHKEEKTTTFQVGSTFC